MAEKLRAGAGEDVRSQDDDDRRAECARRRRIRDTLEKLGWALLGWASYLTARPMRREKVRRLGRPMVWQFFEGPCVTLAFCRALTTIALHKSFYLFFLSLFFP